MIVQFKQILAGQLEAGLCMLNDCIQKCPDAHWNGLIAKYPFWQVAYHTLCFVDVYLAPSDAAWQPRTAPGPKGGLHPKGRLELDGEYPSRQFDKGELIEYVAICRQRIHDALAAETGESLAGESGFPHLRFSRAELHLYNLRHVQHHAGQLSAYLHRVGIDTDWVKAGWR